MGQMSKIRLKSDWNSSTRKVILSDDVRALLAGEIGFIRIPDFFEARWCQELMRRFLAGKPAIYKYLDRGAVQILQLGQIYYQTTQTNDSYFRENPHLNKLLRQLYSGGEDPLIKLQGLLSEATGWRVVAPLGHRGPMCTDLVRAAVPGSYAPIHNDAYRADIPPPFEFRVVHHLSWNMYLSVSEEGGELAVYQRSYQEGDSAHKVPGIEGAYLPAVVAGARRTHYRPRVGDLVMINAGRYYHEVFRTGGPTHRAAANSYIGINPDREEMMFWT